MQPMRAAIANADVFTDKVHPDERGEKSES
jgi:hypothetical protein